MANAFLKPEVIVAQALGLLQREIVLPALFHTYTLNDFKGAKNDTINIPVRARLDAREIAMRATGSAREITSDELSESSRPVRLTKIAYSAVDITDEELTLDIKSFGEQVLTPQARAIAEAFEGYLHTEIQGGTYVDDLNSVEWDTSTTSAYKMALKARRILNEANAPLPGRFLLVGPGAEEAILGDEKFREYSSDGLGQSALRDAQIGRLAQFNVVTSNLVAEDEMYALTPEAFVMGNVAPAVPGGAAFGQAMRHEDVSLRWVRDYAANVMTDRSVLSTFVGTAEIDDGVQPDTVGGTANANAGDPYNARAVKITLTDGSV